MIKLKDEADAAGAPFRQLGFIEIANALAIDIDGSAGRRIEAGDEVEQRRLARAARSHQGEKLALGHFEGQLLEHVNLLAAAPKILAQILDLNDRLTHGWSPIHNPESEVLSTKSQAVAGVGTLTPVAFAAQENRGRSTDPGHGSPTPLPEGEGRLVRRPLRNLSNRQRGARSSCRARLS